MSSLISSNHPDGKGSAMIGGVEYWVSSWNKKTKDGKPWRSLSFVPKDAQKPVKQAQKGADSGFDDMSDDIPFASSSMTYDMTTRKQRRMDRYK